MATNKPHTTITQSVYDAVKICLNSGNTITETAKFMGISFNIVSDINKSETLEEYKAIRFSHTQRRTNNKQLAAIKAKEKGNAHIPPEPVKEAPPEPVKVVHEQSVTIQATHYMTEELREMKEILKSISRKLAAIVEDLYGTKEG